MKLAGLAAAVLAVLPASAAFAQASTAPVYVELRAGAFLPQGDDLDDPFGTGLGAQVTAGRRLHPNVAAELGVGWLRTASDEERDSAGNTLQLVASTIPFTASARFLLPLGAVEPYALAGVGLFRTTVALETGGPDLGDHSIDDTATAFGFQLGAGATVALSERSFVGAEAKLLRAKSDLEVGGFEDEVAFEGLFLNASFGFRF